MTQSKHTPGPWQIIDHDDWGYHIDIRDETGGLDVRVDNPYEAAFSTDNPEVCNQFQPIVEANANLIVVAPELLDMLEEIVSDQNHGIWSNLDKIKKLIAKAKGEE